MKAYPYRPYVIGHQSNIRDFHGISLCSFLFTFSLEAGSIYFGRANSPETLKGMGPSAFAVLLVAPLIEMSMFMSATRTLPATRAPASPQSRTAAASRKRGNKTRNVTAEKTQAIRNVRSQNAVSAALAGLMKNIVVTAPFNRREIRDPAHWLRSMHPRIGSGFGNLGFHMCIRST